MSDADAAARQRYVFVYGTLRRGGANDINRLTPSPRYVGTASVPGTLYHLGAYPGLVLGDATGSGGAPVRGEVYAISAELERTLDEIEEVQPQPTSEYFKRHIPLTVTVAGGGARTLECLCYEYNRARLRDQPVIASGDWMRQEADDQASDSA